MADLHADVRIARAPGSMRNGYTPDSHDPRIDFFRGIALLFIFINHIPENAVSWLTSRALGLSDAAEIFIFLGGYSTALAYRKIAPFGLQPMARKAIRRTLVILRYHAGLVILVMSASYVLSRGLGIVTGYEIFLDRIETDPLLAIVAIPLLGLQAPLLDILPLYVVVLLAAPLMIWLMARSPLTLLLTSILVWMFAGRFFPLVPTITDDVYWAFNPFCWQLMFVIGLVCGWRRHEGPPLFATPETRAVLDFAATTFCVFGLMVMICVSSPDPQGAIAERLREFYWRLNKQCLDLWRIADFLTSAYLISRCVGPQASWLGLRPMRWIRAVGAVPLQMFALGVLLSFAGKFVTGAFGSDILPDAIVSLSGIAILLVAGTWFAVLKRCRGQDSQLYSQQRI